MSTVNEQFGAALTEGIAAAAHRQRKAIAAVEADIAQALNYTSHTVKYWRRGHVPKEPNHVAYLVRYCVTQGHLDRAWAENILAQARFAEPAALLRELYPSPPGQEQTALVRQNLPPRYGQVVGRQADLERVLEGLSSDWPLVAIEGLGGVGKTTLALEAAHRCLHGEPPAFAAAVWISAKDQPEQKLWLENVLNAIGCVLDYPGLIQLPPPRKLDEADKLLRLHRTLIVVDNFETIQDGELVDWMCRMPEPSKALLTSRHCQLRNVWSVHLHGLAEPDALDLLRRQARRLGMDADWGDEALAPLAQITAGNPKALEMALGCVKYGAHSLDDVIAGLQTAGHPLDNLFADLFERGWNILTPDAQHALLALSFFADTVGQEALGAAAWLKGGRLDAALQQLVEMSLVDACGGAGGAPLRYSLHPLTRAFAASQLRAAPDWELAARQRWLRWHVGFAQQYGGLDWDNWANFQVLGQERSNILRTAQWCFHSGDLDSLWKLTQATLAFFNSTSYWDERERLLGWVLELARQRREKRIIAACLKEMAWTFYLTYRLTEARIFLQEARALAAELKDPSLLAWILAGQAYLEEYGENYPEAERLLGQAEALRLTLPRNRIRERLAIQIRYQQGRVAWAQKHWPQARLYFTETLSQAQRARFERAVAYAAHFLGNLAWQEQRPEEARRCYARAGQIVQPWNDRRLLARLEFSRARLLAADGEREAAIGEARTALERFRSFNMRREAQEAARWLVALEAGFQSPGSAGIGGSGVSA